MCGLAKVGESRDMRKTLLSLALALLVAGCANPVREPGVPLDLTAKASPYGMPANIRFWPTIDTESMVAEGFAALRREQAAVGPGPLPPANYLAISGGGDQGAFGAGLLHGWSENGTRPMFKIVTGVSTGALSAPFAFLGPDYDDELKAVYTTIKASDVFTPRGFLAVLNDDAMADTLPLFRTVEKYITPDLLQHIAAEYAKGRLLLIGTTNLDALQPVIWNIGAIAASGNPNATALVRKILMASSAIPGAFPPVLIDVEIDGKRYQEMHVDGGAMAQVFLYPPSLRVAEATRAVGVQRQRIAYVIRNARLDPDWASVDRNTLSIANRAISSLIQTQGVGDLYRIYLTTHQDGVDFNLAFIGPDFGMKYTEQFDPTYMGSLFDYGYRLGKAGYPWRKAPPGISPLKQVRAEAGR
jgi:predicted acylesterase/phospholipase RssA